MAKARSLEISEMEASGMERKLPTEEANLVSQKQHSKADRQTTPTLTSTKICRQCGLSWLHNAKPCPAKEQVRRKCDKQNHCAKMCCTKVPPQRQRQQSHVNQVTSDPDSSSDEEYLAICPKSRYIWIKNSNNVSNDQ